MTELRRITFLPIQMRTVSQAEQRYETVGDWFEKDGQAHIVATDLGNPLFNFLLMVHELIEYWLCKVWGITDEECVAFDKEWEKYPHPRGAEAGNDPRAPYHWPHVFANLVERFLCFVLRVDYLAYDEAVIRAEEAAHAEGAVTSGFDEHA